MKDNFNYSIKNNYLSSGFLQFKALYNIRNDKFKENKISTLNSNQQN